jgi:hypothetical protein
LKTLPIILGEKKAIDLANISLLLFIIISAFHYTLTEQLFVFYAFLVSTIITVLVLNSKYLKKINHYHYGFLDGMISLQTILVLAFYFIKT